MGLLNKTESDTDNAGQGADNSVEQNHVNDAAETDNSAKAVAERALAQHKAAAGAVATYRKVDTKVLDRLKDALRVEWDTLASLKANQGRIIEGESEKNLGEYAVIRLLSWQDLWVVSPNDLKADKSLVKYASNANEADDGTNLSEHLAHLKSLGYDKAKKSQRCVIVGALLSAEKGKDSKLLQQLVQMDLSPKSKTQFDRLRATVAWGLSTGSLNADDVETLKLTAEVADGPDKTTYTRVNFEVYKAE